MVEEIVLSNYQAGGGEGKLVGSANRMTGVNQPRNVAKDGTEEYAAVKADATLNLPLVRST